MVGYVDMYVQSGPHPRNPNTGRWARTQGLIQIAKRFHSSARPEEKGRERLTGRREEAHHNKTAPLSRPRRAERGTEPSERSEREEDGIQLIFAAAAPSPRPPPRRGRRRRPARPWRRGEAAAAAPRRAAHGLRRGLHPDLRQRQPRPPPRGQARPPLPRRVHRRRVRLPGPLPPRLLQRRREAPRRLRRRSRRRLLPDERRHVREDPRRAGLRVPRQRARPRVAGADQRVRQRQHRRRPGGALRPPLRPHRRLPPLLNPLDQAPHRVLRGRDADQGGGEDGGHGRGVPLQAHVPLRHHLGRLRLGHPRRPLQGGLQVRAVRRRVRRPRAPGLPRQPHVPFRVCVVVRCLALARAHRRRAVGRAAQGHGGVQARPHDVLLLPRQPPVPRRPVGVRRRKAASSVRPGRDEVRRRPPAPPRRARPPLRRRDVIPRGRRAHPPVVACVTRVFRRREFQAV